MVSHEIEIAAPPELVRNLLLDFPRLMDWHDGTWLKSITSKVASKPTGHNLVLGDQIVTSMGMTEFHETIEINSPTHFRTKGPWYGLLTGYHSFSYLPSAHNPGHTTLVQEETFTGPLAFYMRPGMPGGKKTSEGFAMLNEQVKVRAEEMAAESNLGGGR